MNWFISDVCLVAHAAQGADTYSNIDMPSTSTRMDTSVPLVKGN